MANTKISALSAASTPLTGSEVVPLNQSGVTDSATVANILGATQSSGTANGVQFLNGSKISSTSSNITYDGTTLTILTPAGVKGFVLSTASGNSPVLRFSSGDGYRFDTYVQSGGVGVVQNSDDDSPIIWQMAGTEVARLTAAGNYTPKAAGTGINFTANTPASGYTSQLLNWYEEGTWTPSPTNVTVVSGTPVWSGKYTRIGRQVTATWKLSGGANVTITTSSYISLPFTASDIAWGAYGNNATNAFIGGMAAFGASLYFGTAIAGLSSAGGTIVFQV